MPRKKRRVGVNEWASLPYHNGLGGFLRPSFQILTAFVQKVSRLTLANKATIVDLTQG